MITIKKLTILSLLSIQFIYSSELITFLNLDHEEMHCEQKQEELKEQVQAIILESSDGKEFEIEVDVALKSKLIETLYFAEYGVSKFYLNIDASTLDLFIDALYLIDTSKGELLYEIYDHVNESIFKNKSCFLYLSDLLEKAIYLDCPILENAIAYKLAQVCYYQRNYTPLIVKCLHPDHLPILAKQYILQHKNLLDFADNGLNNKQNAEIYSKVKISVNDWLDYDNSVKIKNEHSYEYNLSLNYRLLTSLKGLERIKEIQKVQRLDLSNNYLQEIGIDFSKLPNLKALIITNNLIEELPISLRDANPKLCIWDTGETNPFNKTWWNSSTSTAIKATIFTSAENTNISHIGGSSLTLIYE